MAVFKDIVTEILREGFRIIDLQEHCQDQESCRRKKLQCNFKWSYLDSRFRRKNIVRTGVICGQKTHQKIPHLLGIHAVKALNFCQTCVKILLFTFINGILTKESLPYKVSSISLPSRQEVFSSAPSVAYPSGTSYVFKFLWKNMH